MGIYKRNAYRRYALDYSDLINLYNINDNSMKDIIAFLKDNEDIKELWNRYNSWVYAVAIVTTMILLMELNI